MAAIPPPASEAIDERIDKRLALLRDSIELKLTKEVDGLLKSRFESTGKLLSWAFGLVAIAFTAFGIKTLFDVKEVARTTAIEEVKKKLAIDDPNSDFRRDVDKVVARGLIDSYLLTIAKAKGERFGLHELVIPETDLRRLRAVVADEKTSEKDFSDALEVLIKSQARGRDESLDRLVQALGNANDERYRWMKEQPEKRAALFRLYSGDKLVALSATILAQEKTSKPLLLAAIKYSGAKDRQSAKLLERLSGDKDDDVSIAAMMALARIAPDSPTIRSMLAKPRQTNRDSDWANAIRVAIEVAKPARGSIFEEDPNIEKRHVLAAGTLRNAIRDGFVFRLSQGFAERSTPSLYVSSKKNYSTLHGVSSDLVRGSAKAVVQHVLRQAAAQPEELLTAMRAFCLEEDERCWGLFRVELKEGARVILKGGQEIQAKGAPAGVTMRPDGVKADSAIVVTWTDSDAVQRRGQLENLLGAEKMSFSVGATKSLLREEEED